MNLRLGRGRRRFRSRWRWMRGSRGRVDLRFGRILECVSIWNGNSFLGVWDHEQGMDEPYAAVAS